jgi:hypothetical protein
MALREHERDLILNSQLNPDIKTMLSSEKKVMEGYPLRLEVDSSEQVFDIIQVVRILNDERNLGLFSQANP